VHGGVSIGKRREWAVCVDTILEGALPSYVTRAVEHFGPGSVRSYTPVKQQRWAGQPVLVCYGANHTMRCAQEVARGQLRVANIIHGVPCSERTVTRADAEREEGRTAYEQEVMVELNIQKTDHTFIGALYAANWRLVSVANCVVGLSPFRDLSLVLPVYHAGVVIRQLRDYVLEDKARSAPWPYSLFLPRKGGQDVDYFLTTHLPGMRALINYSVCPGIGDRSRRRASCRVCSPGRTMDRLDNVYH
jgi:hypothetical protein